MYTIAIIGRPNVGKSSLFNTLLQYRRSIVFDEAGTTMDEVQEPVLWQGQPLALVDSQGIFSEEDTRVLDRLLSRADAVLFVVDATAGPTPFDRWIAKAIHETRKPVLLLLNKSENVSGAPAEFAELGFKDMLEVSAHQRSGLSRLKSWCVERARESGDAEAPRKPELTAALIGRPNTGKSTLMNRLCRVSVSRVSDQPLTTRDPIRFTVSTNKGAVRFIDTAGIRRPSRKKGEVEEFSIQASRRAIREADVVLLLIASHERITDQDMRLLSLLEKEGKPAAVLLNFWDCVDPELKRNYVGQSEFFRYLEKFPSLPLSGRTGQGTRRIPELVFELYERAKRRVPTSQLNRVVDEMLRRNPPPQLGKNRFNILYASQVSVQPPTFVFFMNRKGALPLSYRKYVENYLRQQLGFGGQPLRIHFRSREDRAQARGH